MRFPHDQFAKNASNKQTYRVTMYELTAYPGITALKIEVPEGRKGRSESSEGHLTHRGTFVDWDGTFPDLEGTFADWDDNIGNN